MKWHKLTLRKMNDEEKKKYQGCEAYYEGDVPEYSLDFSVKYIVAKKYNDNFRIIIDNFIFESYMSLPEFEDTDIDEDETIYWCEIPEFDFLGGLNMNDDPIKPKHYQLENGEEVKDVIAKVVDGNAFDIGNVIKYIFRAEKKNGLYDYKKAREYLSNKENSYMLNKKFDDLKKYKKYLPDEKIKLCFINIIQGLYEEAYYFLDEYIKEKEKENEK